MSVREKIQPLIEKGLSPAEIRKITGYSYATVWNAMNPELITKREVEPPVERPAGWNKDKQACKKCKYKGKGAGKVRVDRLSSLNGCDFIVHTGHMRGCKVEDCTRFVKGNKIKANPKGGWNEGMGNDEKLGK